jgi:elongation factor Ts
VITANDIQALRQATGAGMMDAKRALTDADGDVDKAKDLLRERGLASAKKRSERVQTEGTIGHYLHLQSGRPVIGVLVELASETDFVAKSEEFQEVARHLAMHIAASRPVWVQREDVPEDILAKERELIAAQARNEGKPDNVIERIVEGKLTSFYEDNVLYDQTFVRGEVYEGTIGGWMTDLTARLGENIGVRRFSRLSVGEDTDS